MTFTIFNKTGEFTRIVNGEKEWDGDEGYYEEIDVPYDKLQDDMVNILYYQYFHGILNERLNEKAMPEVKKSICEQIRLFINELNMWDELEETYYEALQNQYEEEFEE